MNHPNFFSSSKVYGLFPTAARTSTANGSTITPAVGAVGEALCILDSAVGTGTSPTLDVTLEHSSDGTTWVALNDKSGTQYAFTQVTDGGASLQEIAVRLTGYRGKIRAVATITGTTPSFTFSVNIVVGGFSDLVVGGATGIT